MAQLPGAAHIHHSFDFQLHALPSLIIDWGPARRTVGRGPIPAPSTAAAPQVLHSHSEWGFGSRGAPASHLGASSSGGDDTPRCRGAQRSWTVNASGAPWKCRDCRAVEAAPTVSRRILSTVESRLLAQSTGTIPLYHRDTFSVTAGLRVGIAALSTAARPGGGSDWWRGAVVNHLLQASETLQLEALWGRRQWVAALALPLHPIVRWPTYQLTVQTRLSVSYVYSDKLVFSWNGFRVLCQSPAVVPVPPGPAAVTVPAEAASTPVADADAVTEAPPPLRRGSRWLRSLWVGVGFAVKKDLASGVNVYWGCSGTSGSGVSFSAHMDALRRTCCSIAGSWGSVDVAARMRVNLITLHQTGLDAGLGIRPGGQSHTTLRVAKSFEAVMFGLQAEDVVHNYAAAWLDRLSRSAASGGSSAHIRAPHLTPVGGDAAPKGDAAPVAAEGYRFGARSVEVLLRWWRRPDVLASAAAAVTASSGAVTVPMSSASADPPGVVGAVATAVVSHPAPFPLPATPFEAHPSALFLPASYYKRRIVALWQAAWELNWVDAVLRSPRFDVSVGVTRYANRPEHLSFFCVITAQ